MKIGSPRKGAELDPRVRAHWQEQVTAAVKALNFTNAWTVRVILDFLPLGAQMSELVTAEVPGARAGGLVIVTPVAGLQAGVLFDGYVSATDVVSVRASNFTSSLVVVGSAQYSVAVINP